MIEYLTFALQMYETGTSRRLPMRKIVGVPAGDPRSFKNNSFSRINYSCRKLL